MVQTGVRLAACLTTAGLVLCCLAAVSGCSREGAGDAPGQGWTVRLAATFSTSDSGLLAAILPVFTEKSGLTVEAAILGSGGAVAAAQRGEADVILTHDRQTENAFVKAGYGLNRRDVMVNDFVLLGPPDDPAGILGTRNVRDALVTIRDGEHLFVSRSDSSGNHARELSLWRLTGSDPGGSWYLTAGKGMLETLQFAAQVGAYVLADRSTYLQHRQTLDLIVVVENDSRLVNTYSVIAVNPAKVPGVNFPGAMQLIEFLVSPEGQALIGNYGTERLGTGLFVPVTTR